jgi:hypothetical protein
MHKQLLALAVAGSAFLATPGRAQMYPFSQRSTLVQSVAFTTITIEYGRPTARGRALWGALVPWDSVWHPGADDATRIRFSRDVVLEGQPVKAGEYTTWLIPRASNNWTFILSHAVGISHTPYPGRDKDALRVDVTADSASHLESMTYLFPAVLREDATLRLQWGTRGIALRLKAPARPPE